MTFQVTTTQEQRIQRKLEECRRNLHQKLKHSDVGTTKLHLKGILFSVHPRFMGLFVE